MARILVGECAAALRERLYDFDLGLIRSGVASVTASGEVMVCSVEFDRIFRFDGLVQSVEIWIEAFDHLTDGNAVPHG